MALLPLHPHGVCRLDRAAFVAAVDVLADDVVTVWLRHRPGTALPSEVTSTLLDRDQPDVDLALAGMPLDDDALDRLAATRRVTVARAVAGRDDLSADQLRQLLARDDPETSQTVWDHPACTDQLRRLILSGTTMNPRARDPHRLIEVPVVDVPARLADAAATSASPAPVAGWLAAHADDDQDRQAGAVRLADLAWWHLEAADSPYEARAVRQVVGDGLSAVQEATASPTLRSVAAELGKLLCGWGRIDWPQVRRLRGELAGVDLPGPTGRQAEIEGLLQAGRVCPADLARLDRLTADPAELPVPMQDLLARHRPDLLGPGWWRAALDDPDRWWPGGIPVPPEPVLQAWVDDDGRLPLSSITFGWQELPAGLLLAAVGPAASVLARQPTSEQAAALLADRFGDDRRRWQLLAALVDDFDGTVIDLADTVDRLATGTG